MPGGYLFGWDPDAPGWVKVSCNPAGELDIDATAIFENPPTEDEAAKGPSSEWAFDHDADAAAHHAKYTDANSRAAINNILSSTGKITRDIDCDYNGMRFLKSLEFKYQAGETQWVDMVKDANGKDLKLHAHKSIGGYADLDILIYRTDHNVKVIHDDSFQTALALYLEESPTNGVVNKAPTSNWAFDHDANANAHHTPPTAGDFNHQDLANRGANDHHTPPTAGDFNHQDLVNRGAADHHAKYTNAEAIAAAAVYEENPTDNLTTKAPTSNWAFDHKADVAAHHSKYTDADAIAAAAVYENPPTEDENAKAPTSEWAFDHNTNTSAHHAKYLDAAAVAACGLDGTLRHTISGVAFKPHSPNSVAHSYLISGSLRISDNSINVYASIELPDGVTVTWCAVYGNAGASSETWTLYRVALSDQTRVAMASALVTGGDSTITNPVINNSLYVYFITVTSLMANDDIHAARINFTL